VAEAIVKCKTRVIDIDLLAYFDTVKHSVRLEKVSRRINDDEVMGLLVMMLKASGKQGVPQGGGISPVLSNLYLTEVDRMLEWAKEATRYAYAPSWKSASKIGSRISLSAPWTTRSRIAGIDRCGLSCPHPSESPFADSAWDDIDALAIRPVFAQETLLLLPPQSPQR
jgi:hypothetical protein